MASVLESADLIDSGDQMAFNLAVWKKVLGDAVLAGLPHRVETDRFGQIVMSPPPAPEHGEEQFGVGKLLDHLLPGGHVITECPLSTSEGVKLIDVTWISNARRQAQRGTACFTQAPEICVEVVSSSNTQRELVEKKQLYFAAGAEEVWFCHRDGQMEFFVKEAPETAGSSKLCASFPPRIAIN
jgi:Uma2 family endonuclease